MSEYHKIPTVFKRDPDNSYKTLLEGDYATEALAYLANNEWEFTEKVDGTNIRVILNPGHAPQFGGRTDRAQIPATLLGALQERFFSQSRVLANAFPDGAVLYGEGYGAKIQKAGGSYRSDQDFVLFDVRVGAWWLERAAVEDIADKFDIDVVPVIGRGTLPDMVTAARNGITSKWGDFEAEGIVARPMVELEDRAGRRIITKIKCKDFA